MNGDSWNIRRAKGGFIVEVSEQTDRVEATATGFKELEMVFTDSSALLNFFHNELVGSN